MQSKGMKLGVAGIFVAFLAIGGLVYGQSMATQQVTTGSAAFTCPLTGEELPCGKCCPLDESQ